MKQREIKVDVTYNNGKRPNDNCLKGFQCPTCGWTDSFDIVAECTVTMLDGGTTDERDFEWDGDAHCSCCNCSLNGTVQHFRMDARQQLVRGIVPFLERNSIEAEHLDGAVDQEKSRQRADINNGGLDEQVEYLLECGWTEEEILGAAELDAGMPPRTLLMACAFCEKKSSARTVHLVNKDGTDQWCCDACWDERLR